jgi:hypothetical protein
VIEGNDIRSSLDKAADEIINQSYTQVKGTMVPNRIGSNDKIDMEYIRADMSYKMSKSYMSNLMVKDKSGKSYEERIAHAIDNNRVRFVMNPDGGSSHMEVQLKKSFGTNGWIPAYNKDGSKVTTDYIEAGVNHNIDQNALGMVRRQ